MQDGEGHVEREVGKKRRVKKGRRRVRMRTKEQYRQERKRSEKPIWHIKGSSVFVLQ